MAVLPSFKLYFQKLYKCFKSPKNRIFSYISQVMKTRDRLSDVSNVSMN